MEFSYSILISVILISPITSQENTEPWIETNVKLFLEHSESFSSYGDFIANLPELYSNIRRTSTGDIIQNQPTGSEFPYDGSLTFKPSVCQNGYEIKGFGDGLLMCSKIGSMIKNNFTIGSSVKCVRNICHLKPISPPDEVIQSNELSNDLEDIHPAKGDTDPLLKRNNDDDDGGADSGTDDGPDDVQEEFETVPTKFDCVKDMGICSITICPKFGVQGFGESGYACASSRNPSELTCANCQPKKSCLSHQFVCGVLRLTQNDVEAVGIICCSNTQQNVVVVPAENNGETVSSTAIEAIIQKHFENSFRTTFASVYVPQTGDNFFYALCPPDFFVQGYNGQQLLCAREIHGTDVTYSGNANGECSQRLCFPEDPEISCLQSSNQKFKICKDLFVTHIILQTDSSPCEDSQLSNNHLSDHGLACDESQAKCTDNSATCGLILRSSGTTSSISGFICCNPEPISKTENDFVTNYKQEFLFFHKTMQMKGRVLTVEQETSEVSKLFNSKIQENLHPNEVLEQFITPLYNKKLWMLQLPNSGSNNYYPETLIMCPNNTYVRGVPTLHAPGDAYRILCSEEPPFLEAQEAKLLGPETYTEHVCPQLTPSQDYYACGVNSKGETFSFCPKGYFTPIPSGGTFCSEDPCGNNAAVCGATNTYYHNTPLMAVCCERHTTYPKRIPNPTDANGNINPAAVKYVMTRLDKEYTVANNGRLGTQEQVISYHREKHGLSRIMQASNDTDYLSAIANEAITSGKSIPEGLTMASEQSKFRYWLIDEDYWQYNTNSQLIKVYLCPPSLYPRARALTNILCSEQPPKWGKRYTPILGADSTCYTTSPGNGADDFNTCNAIDNIGYGIGSTLFCSRGYFGYNYVSDRHNKCHDGFQCKDSSGDQNAKVCGLLMVPNTQWEKIICCNASSTT